MLSASGVSTGTNTLLCSWFCFRIHKLLVIKHVTVTPYYLCIQLPRHRSHKNANTKKVNYIEIVLHVHMFAVAATLQGQLQLLTQSEI